jgi:hypothetical protein
VLEGPKVPDDAPTYPHIASLRRWFRAARFGRLQTNRAGKTGAERRTLSSDQPDHPFDMAGKDSHAPMLEGVEDCVPERLSSKGLQHFRMGEDVHRAADTQFREPLSTNAIRFPLASEWYCVLCIA